MTELQHASFAVPAVPADVEARSEAPVWAAPASPVRTLLEADLGLMLPAEEEAEVSEMMLEFVLQPSSP